MLRTIEVPSKQYQPLFYIWAINSNAPKNFQVRKNLEGSYIVPWKPDINEQKDFERLVRFRLLVLSGDNNLVLFHLCRKETVLKREKVYKCFIQDCMFKIDLVI